MQLTTAAIALCFALVTAWLLRGFVGLPHSKRFESIDGLRGFLAFFVFLHHSIVWRGYVRYGVWDSPGSRLFDHMGISSVSLFFMITAFLFWNKLSEGRAQMDWATLYVSRVLRLVPLYLFAVALVFLFVALASGFRIVVPMGELTKQVAQWIAFCIPDSVNINHVRYTAAIIAAVVWSLHYEWIFYGLLPLCFFLFFSRRLGAALLISVGAVAVGFVATRQLLPFISFLGGILAALLYPRLSQTAFIKGRIVSTMIVPCAFTVSFLPVGAFPLLTLILLSLVFIPIACGNTFFGLLASVPAKILGQVSYSVYLLHGIFLYFIFTYIFGFEEAANFSPVRWGLITCVSTIPLIVICAATYRLIEAPALGQVEPVRAWLARTGVTWFQTTIPQTAPSQIGLGQTAASRQPARQDL